MSTDATPVALLDTVSEAARDVEDAQLHLRASVALAVAADVPISHVADAAGVGRPTIYRWIREHEEAAPASFTVEVGPALTDGITVLRSAVPPYTAGELAKRADDRSMWMRINTLRLGMKNVDPEGWRTLSERETGLVYIATAVATIAERYHERTRQWPSTVTLPDSPSPSPESRAALARWLPGAGS